MKPLPPAAAGASAVTGSNEPRRRICQAGSPHSRLGRCGGAWADARTCAWADARTRAAARRATCTTPPPAGPGCRGRGLDVPPRRPGGQAVEDEAIVVEDAWHETQLVP